MASLTMATASRIVSRNSAKLNNVKMILQNRAHTGRNPSKNFILCGKE
jgi:hypothetical protein